MLWPLTVGTRVTPKVRPAVSVPAPRIRPHRCTFGDFVHQFDGAFAVAKLEDAGLHGDTQCRAGLDGVKADVVAEAHQLGHVIEIIDATIRSQ